VAKAKAASVVSIKSSDANGFRWVWRSSDGERQSRADFAYFYECVESARRAGYSVELRSAPKKRDDGGSDGLR
jgi:hypothetical protein